MVVLIFLVAVAPVSEGAWKRPVERRYALEVERREYAEGSAAAYREILRQVSLHPRSVEGIREVIIAVDRIAPSAEGESVNRTALDIARQAGRFQAGTLGIDAVPDEPVPAPDPGPAPEGDDLDAPLGRLAETQRQRAEREERTDRFAESASLAVTRALDTLDLGDNEAVQLVKEYLGGLVEDGPVKTAFHRWGEGVGRRPPEGGRLVRIDVSRLTAVAYERTAAAVDRADGPAHVLRAVRRRRPGRGRLGRPRGRPGEPAPVRPAGHRPLHGLRRASGGRERHGRHRHDRRRRPSLRPAIQRRRGPRRRGEIGTLGRRDGASPLR